MHVVSYDSQRRSLKVRLDDKSVLIDGLADEIVFRKQGRGHPEELALWLDRSRAEVLVKMMEYSLRKLNITESSRTALEAILPAAQRIAQGPTGQPAEPQLPEPPQPPEPPLPEST